MSLTVVDRFAWDDDTGAGLDGTLIDNDELQRIFDAIDEAIAPVIQIKTAAYTAVSTDDVIKATSGTWTLGLFTAVGNDGKPLEIANLGTGDITVDPHSTQTIGGASTWRLGPNQALRIRSDGANWVIVSLSPAALAKNEVWIPCAAMAPYNNGGAGGCGFHENLLNGNWTLQGLPFDPTTDENANFSIRWPKAWNRGTVTFQFYWLNRAGGSGSVVWLAFGGSAGDGEATGSVGSSVTVTDAAQAANAMAISSVSSALTITGTPAVGDLCHFLVSRFATTGSDTYGSDAYLVGVVVSLSTDAPTDD